MAARANPSPLFENYRPRAGARDAYFDEAGRPRSEAARVIQLLDELGAREFNDRQKLANATFLRGGVTFSVYSDRRGAERIVCGPSCTRRSYRYVVE